jgi:uncharacterized membrane protein
MCGIVWHTVASIERQRMDPNTPPNQPPAMPPPLQPAQPNAGQFIPADEIQRGKLFALLSYAINFVGLPFWIVPLAMRDNDFSLYHAKQNFILFIFIMAIAIVALILSFFCIGFLLIPVVMLASIAGNVIGIINVSNNVCKPLPLIGQLGESWFAGITKLQPVATPYNQPSQYSQPSQPTQPPSQPPSA